MGNRTALQESCTGVGTENDPDMSWSHSENTGRALFLTLAILAAVHFVVTMFMNVVQYKLDGEKRRVIRSFVEPIAQILITIFGMILIVPLAFVLKNPPCNYAFTKFIHNE